MSTLGAFIDDLASHHRGRVALISATRQMSYAELAEHANRIAKGLARLGVSKGTRVGLLMPNNCDWLACAFAVFKLGALLVPLNTLLRAAELAQALRFADVTVLLTVAGFLKHDYVEVLAELCPEIDATQRPLTSAQLPALREVVVLGGRTPASAHNFEQLLASAASASDAWLVAAQAEVAPADPATIFFTSGTTALPKGAVHTHASMLRSAHNVADRLGLDSSDRTWGYLPFFFTGGLVAVGLATLSRGGAVLLQDVFDAGAALKLMSENGCTTFFAWPHQAEAIAAHPDFSRQPLRIRKGPGAQAAWASKIFTSDHQAVGTWGMTETGPMAACSRFDDPPAVRSGAHGRPMPGLEFRIVEPDSGRRLANDEEGELCVRGDSLMGHYYRMAAHDCFDSDGFFHSGDLARIDAQGLLHFVGRLKDVIKTAGVNVAAAEVEALLLRHPQVKIAHVVGVAHPIRGENVAAFVVRNAATCTDDDLLGFCRKHLASYKVPRHLFFCAESDLPVLGSGKVNKQALRAEAAQRVAGTNAASG